MKLNGFAGMVVAVLLMAPTASLASNTVLSGVFDGSESKTAPLPGSCGGDRQIGYQDVGEFTVSAAGEYMVMDAFNRNDGLDVTGLIYAGSFNPDLPEANLLTPVGVDWYEFVNLDIGVTYRLVVQQYCQNREGAWAVTFSGPGEVTSASVRSVPEMTQGTFTDDDPRTTTDCANDAQYIEHGPLQVASSGTYYYTDVLLRTGSDIDLCMQVYTAPFNPADPDANRVQPNHIEFGVLDDDEEIELESGQDYYFVVQPLDAAATGDYFFVFAPPAPFRINKTLAGAWYDTAVDGQGFLLDASEGIDYMFLAWFTFDVTRPDAGVPSGIGGAGQRWLTAQGPYDGNVADMIIVNTTGMVFNSAQPEADRVQDGTMTVEFTSCTEGTIDYNIPSAAESGTIPIQPSFGPDLDPSNQELCESMTEVPGMPGLL